MKNTLNITLKHLIINQEKQIGIQFMPNKVIQAFIKQLPDVKWSNEFNIVYIKNTKGNLNLIFSTFKNVAWVNCHNFFPNRPINTHNHDIDVTWFRNRKIKKGYRICPQAGNDSRAFGTFTLWNVHIYELYSPFKAHTKNRIEKIPNPI